jgi:hypothetical protein
MWPGRVKSDGREVGDDSARTVRARSCAEMPVVVPNGNGSQLMGKSIKFRRTGFMIDCDCIGRSVSFLVCREHRRYVQLVQALSRECDANVPTDSEIKQTARNA